jgi:hypothetical protein
LKNTIQSNPPREQGVLARRIHHSFALADAAGYFFNRLVDKHSAPASVFKTPDAFADTSSL